jgi:peptidoglycan-associated lipoprotein
MRAVYVFASCALCATFLFTACAKKTPPVQAPAPALITEELPPSPPPPPPPPPAPLATEAPALTADEIFARKSLDELNAERPLADVFFDLDESSLRSDARPTLQQNAQWLSQWPSTRVTIAGHCDSRGTSEYNLALGERRANAVKQYLMSLGVSADRLLVVSNGEETPFCSEETESCWQQNRRGHFVITAK